MGDRDQINACDGSYCQATTGKILKRSNIRKQNERT